ncbi:MAG TPA: hypothetical protein PKL28_07295 [Rhodocyclaceae bacterium]|nr:hypothetical protein [Rhodocyclaceae bacterium]
MASVALDKFLPNVVVECLHAPEPTALEAIRSACFALCDRALVWRERLDAEAYNATDAEYTVTLPNGAQLVSILSVLVDGARRLNPVTQEAVTSNNPALWTQRGTPGAFTMTALDTFRMLPAPDTTGTFIVSAALAPTRTATTVDSALYERYLDAVVYGAIYRLKRMPGQSWSDAQGGLYYEQRAAQEVNKAVIARNRDNLYGDLRVAPVRFV